ncbi:hypothetical protein CEXT_115401 [Caerostris extrusa]|uniref:Uncharacterized protein n=1 Tax=Caerostris extrusa TaxID=172846 RepID=A0AAV4MU95_CAEEX|nr:hypothetical protein CEXT_115401 [Caerostris extrusa]
MIQMVKELHYRLSLSERDTLDQSSCRHYHLEDKRNRIRIRKNQRAIRNLERWHLFFRLLFISSVKYVLSALKMEQRTKFGAFIAE